MKCPGKHTKVQIPDGDWACPKCGEEDIFFIEITDESTADCSLLHVDDEIVCRACDSVWTGAQIARMYAKKQNLVPCPCCKGTGTIKKVTND